ncbi:MAG: RibD family protein [Gammaproteobacteria bacterium]
MTAPNTGEALIRLYPNPGAPVALEGLYLHSGLREAAVAGPLVYTNFIASVDGRIAVANAEGRHQIPKAIANARDWRLFQELAALADVLITSGRYLRDVAQGKAQDVLPVSNAPAYRDLLAFRRERGLSPQPAVAIVSASLDIPLSALPAPTDREVVIVTGAGADRARQQALSTAGYRLITAGDEDRVDGAQLIAALADLKYQIMYATGGAQLCHTLLAGGQLHRLYLTTAHRLIGGSAFDTPVLGPAFAAAPDLELRGLYFDPRGVDGVGQIFAQYEIRDK